METINDFWGTRTFSGKHPTPHRIAEGKARMLVSHFGHIVGMSPTAAKKSKADISFYAAARDIPDDIIQEATHGTGKLRSACRGIVTAYLRGRIN